MQKTSRNCCVGIVLVYVFNSVINLLPFILLLASGVATADLIRILIWHRFYVGCPS